MYERFTDRARKVMHLANQEAKQLNHEYIGTEHILLGLVKEGSGVAANVLKNLDVDLRKVRLEVERIVQPGPDMDIEGKLPQTPRSKKVIEYSICEARNLNHNYIGTEHLLLGLLREQEGIAAQVLMNLGLRLDTVREEILDLIGHPLLSGEGRANLQSHLVEGLSKTPALDSFGRDLTELARAGTFAPLVGRSADIEKMLVVLTSMRSPCLLLIGERGVGKTALVNGLAGFIARGSLPSGLPQRVVALDLSTPSLRKGSKQDSERIIACLNEASRERVILSIEAAPLLFAEPKSVPTILFQARLRQGAPPIILSLTPAEYYLYIAPSSDKAEVFQALYLDSLSREDTLEILRQERPQYAAYHSVVIPETLLGRIAFLADRSLSGTLPGKAIQLLDYAAALARLRAETLPADVTQLKGGSEFDVKVDEQILNDALTMLKESANYINPDIVAGEDEIPF